MGLSRQLRAAIESLRRTAARAQHEGRQRLPTTVDLAKAAGVSVVTMARAVKYLSQTGEVHALPRRGIVVGSAPDTPAAEPSPASRPARGPRWRRLCAELERMLLSGELGTSGQLPTIRELSGRFRVDFRTMRKAVDMLVERGELYPYQRTYRVRPGPGRHTVDQVVLVAAADTRGELRLYSPRTQETLRSLEAECSRSGVRLTALPWRPSASATGGSAANPLRRLGELGPALGVMVWTAGLPRRDLRVLLNGLAPMGRPVAILDEDDDSPPERSAVRQGVRVFIAADSAGAGSTVGRHLLSLGHRRLAYISAVHGSSWSLRRLGGLEQACAQSGLGARVSRHVLPQFSYRTQFLTDDQVRRRAVENLMDDCVSRPPFTDDVTTGTIRDLREQILPTMKRHMLHEKLLPLFDSALASGATAWVGATDEIAVEALTYLQRRKVAVPQQVSVVGFDDSLEAFLHSLTSHNFNTPSAVRPMLDILLAPRLGAAALRYAKPIEIRGFVNNRSTSGSCHPHHKGVPQ